MIFWHSPEVRNQNLLFCPSGLRSNFFFELEFHYFLFPLFLLIILLIPITIHYFLFPNSTISYFQSAMGEQTEDEKFWKRTWTLESGRHGFNLLDTWPWLLDLGSILTWVFVFSSKGSIGFYETFAIYKIAIITLATLKCCSKDWMRICQVWASHLIH